MDDPTDLNEAQRARADALVIAGRLLGDKASMSKPAGLPEYRSTSDLVDLAQFILDGHHPLEGWEPEAHLVTLSTPGENPGDGLPRDAHLGDDAGPAGGPR